MTTAASNFHSAFSLQARKTNGIIIFSTHRDGKMVMGRNRFAEPHFLPLDYGADKFHQRVERARTHAEEAEQLPPHEADSSIVR